MKSISVKVNDSVQTIAEAKVITKDGQPTIIKANRNANYELINDATGRGPDHIVTKRVGKDLHVSFEENAEESDLIIENFYDYDKSALIGQAESGQYHYYVPDTGLTQDYVTELVIGDIEGQALGGQGYPAPWWIGAEEGSRFGIMPWLVGIAGIAAVGALAGDDNDNTKAPVADTQTPTPQPKPLPVELKIGPSQNPTDAKLSIVLSEGAEKISINLPGLTPIETTVDALKALDTNPASNTYDISINQLVSPGLGNYSLSLVDYQKVIDNIKNGQAVEVTAKKEGFTDGKADDAVTQTPDVDTVNKDGDNFATINPKPNTTNASEVTVSYTPSSGNANPQTITATKVGDQWQATTGNTSITTADTTKAPTDKPSIDPVTGVISIPTSLVNTSQYTPVTAQVTKTTDNKPSLQNNVDLPDTPSVNIPTINSGETDYPITVTPGNDNTSIVTSYTDEAGKPQTITVTKNPDGSYSATQDGKPVKTTPTDGNTPWVNDKNGTLTLPKDSVDNNKPVTTVGKTDNGSAQDATNPANTPKVVANKPTVTQTGLPQQADIVATPGEGNTKTSTTYTDEQGNTKTITATYDPATNTWTAKNPNDPTKDLPTAPTADGKTPYVDSTTGAITFPPASVDNTKPVTMVGEKEGSTPTIATASPAQSPDVAVKPPVTGQKDGDIVATPGDGNTQTQTTYTPEGSNKPITITATRYTNNDGVPDTWVAKNPNDPTKDLPTTNTDGKTPYIDPKTGAITFPPASVDNAKPVAMVGEKEGSIPSVDTIDLTDKAAPIIENIKVDVAVNGAGDKIVLTYDEPLDVNNPPPATSFTVTVDGKKVIPTVEVSGNAVILNVPTPILKDQEVKVAYNKPADTKDNKVIQDQAGNDADSLTSTPAKNNSTMVDTDKDGIPDSQDDDDDNDGVTDADEKLVGTDPTNPTSDGNTPDGKLDSDGDGISNDDESVTKAEDPTATNTDKPTDKDGDGKPDIATAKVPTKPATAPDMTDATDTGVSNSDNITTNKTPSFSVPKPTDGEPVLVINGKVVESTSTPDPKNPNNVILTPKQPLSEGVSQIATATKKSSQVSDPSEPVVVTVDTTAPTGTTATLDPDSDTGVKGDNITSDTTPTIKGKGNKGDTVIVTFPAQDGGKPEVVEVKVDEKGEWSATPTKELKDGANTISVSVKDPAGNVGVVNPAVITINTTKPTATATLDPNSDSGDKGDGITNNTMPKITGKGKEGDTIKVTFPSKDGTPEEKTVTVGKGGTWEVVPTKALKEGENQIGVEVTDKTTGTKTDLPVVKVTVDTTAPTGTTATLDPDSDTGVKGDNITSDTTPTIKGKGNKGDTVIVTFPAQDGGKPEVVEVKVDEKGEWSATPTKELKDGANTISVSVKDPAGNVGVVNPAVITINTTKPTATATLDPNSDSGDKGDGITNNTMPKITGKGKEGDTIKVTFPSKDGTPEEKTVTVGKGGTWEVVPTKALKEGENQIGVEVTDKTTGTKTDLPVVKVTVDTTAPTGTTATLDPDSDTGVKGDNITSDTTPTIKGKGNKGDTVIVTFPAQDGGKPEVVEVKVDEKGEWSATPTKELKDGANTISVSVKDPAGNVGVVNPAVITINTTKPTATATLDPNSDSGDKGDGITNNTMPKITGKGKEGDTIKVTFPSKDGTPEEKTVTVGKGGTWEVVPTKALKEGENQIGVEVTDKTTGTKTDLPVVKVTVDTTAPTGTTATLDPDSDTGVKGDNITSDTTPTIKGKGNKGDTVIVTFPAQDGGKPEVVEVKVDEKGEWSATPTKELKDGANTISVSVKDPAGNVGVVNPAVITINTTKPTATATLDPNSDSGDKGDGITNNTMPKITGKGKEGDTIKVTFPSKDGTPEEKTVTVGKGGTWEVVPTKALKEGENQIGVEVTDKTTGTKTDLPVVKVTVDTTAPTGTTATLDPDSDTGVKGDNITSDTTPTIKGKGNKGDTVIVTFPAQDGGKPEVVEVKVDEKGEWSATPTKELKDGANTISVSVKDPAGNVGVVNPAVITINTTKPTATATLDPNSDSGDKGDGITNNTMPKITGKGKEGDTIKVTFPSKDGTPEEKTVTVGKGGTWEVVPTKALKEGENQIGVEVTDKTTGTKTDLPVVKVTVDTTAPTGTTATLDPDSDTGVKGDNITSDTTPTIKGKGNKGDTVIVTFPAQDGGKPEVVEVKVDEKGEWSATPTKELKDGANTISVSVKDPAGNVGVVNPAVITINTTKPTATATLDPNSDSGDKGDGITNNTMPKITGKGKEGDTIKVTFPSKDGTPEEKTVTVGKGGTWEVVPTKALKEGENQIGVEVTDKTTGTKTDLPVVKVTVDTTAPTGTTATLDPDSDTGVKGDNITSDTTPTIKGKGNKGDTVIVTFPAQDGGKPEVVEVKVDEKGEWSATPTKELKDGANTISVSVKDPAGNVGVVNPATVSVNVDTTAPTAPTPVANSDGSVTADLPKDPQDGDTVTISYTPEQGANKTATLKYDGATKTWKPDPANGDVQVVDGKATLPADKVKDNSLVKVSAADKAGNESPAMPATTVSAKAPASAGVQNDGVVDNTGKTAVDEGQTISTKVTLTNANGNPALKLEYTGTADAADIGTPTFKDYDETKGKITYDSVNGTINVPKGVDSFTIDTPINADGKTETAENIKVKVGGVDANQLITINDTSKGAATIDNSANDGVKTKPASEGGNLVTTVKLVAGKETKLTIKRTGTATDDDFNTPVYKVTKVADGSTATVGDTLTVADGKPTVPAGVTEFTITTLVKTDNLSEGNETVKYTVGGVDGNEAIITDTTPAVAVKSVTNANNATEVNEGASLTTTVTLNRATDKQIELDYKQNLTGATAEDFTSGKPTFTAGVSLSADGTKLIVPKGVSTFDIITPVKADNTTEAAAESFNYTVGGETSGTVTINDTSKNPAPTQISSLTINDDDRAGSDVGIGGQQYTGDISAGAVTNDTTPTLTITLNQALQDNETLELVRYIKDPITKNLIVDGTFTRKTPAKSGSDGKIYTLKDSLDGVVTTGTDYEYKARIFDKNTQAEVAEKTERMRLDNVAEQAVVTSYDPNTKTLKGVSKEIGGTIFISKGGDGKYTGGATAEVQADGTWSMRLLDDDVPMDKASVSNRYWKASGNKDTPIVISMVDKAGNQPKSDNIISDLYVFNTEEHSSGGGTLTPSDTPQDSKGIDIPSAVGNTYDSDFDDNGIKNYGILWNTSGVKNQIIYAEKITTWGAGYKYAFDIGTGEGDDVLYVKERVTSNIRINMGDGDDTLHTGEWFGDGNGRADTRLDMGAGNDTVNIKGNSYITKMKLGSGDDNLYIGGQFGNQGVIEAGDGNDHVHIAGHVSGIAVNGGSKIDMGTGNDTLVIGYSISKDSTINLGTGDDAFHYGFGKLESKVDGGEGTDVFRVFNTAGQPVIISSDNITNFERVDITGENTHVNTFKATKNLFVNKNFATHNLNQDMLLDGDTTNSKLELSDPGFWDKVSKGFADANGNEVTKKAEGVFILSNGRTVKGSLVGGDTKYYYANQDGESTTERYEGNIYEVYTTANEVHNRLLVDLDVQVI